MSEVRRPESRVLTALVGVRMLPAEFRHATDCADRAGTTAAALLRQLLIEHLATEAGRST